MAQNYSITCPFYSTGHNGILTDKAVRQVVLQWLIGNRSKILYMNNDNLIKLFDKCLTISHICDEPDAGEFSCELTLTGDPDVLHEALHVFVVDHMEEEWSDWCLPVDMHRPITEPKSNCTHAGYWKEYVGFSEAYSYCTKCGHKRAKE